MKKIKIFIIIFFLFLFHNRYALPENSDELYQKIDLFSEVLEKIREDYVDDVDQAEVMDAAINGVLQSLDPYSAYMNQEMFDNMETETKGAFGGLGIEVGMEAGVVKVISPIDDTPASRAGIKAGDYIVRIDNTQVQGKTLMEAVNLMRGPPGAPIEITIRRKGEKKAIVVKIVREIIQIKSVTAKIIDKNIGYFRLSAFNENSGQQLKSKIDEFKTNNEIDKFILDLRNNPGGLLSQAIKISDFFLDDGEIVSTRGRNKRENRKWFAKKGDIINGETLVFCHADGSPLLPHSVSQAWRRLVRKAGFPGIRMHDARHTHASLMLEQGVNWKIISERLGYGSVAMALDLYAHASPGLQQAAAHGFDKVLGVVGDRAEIEEMSRV